MEVKLDLHIHSEHSPDGRMALDEIVACARARGLQGVAVCDHDRALTETWDAPDFLLIPGVELSTDQGHLLGLFVTEQIEARELGAAIDAVHACGGLAVMAHPFERSCDAQRLDAYLDRLDGIEVWNGRADRKNPQANAMACALAQRAQKPVTAGSDAHLPEEIGNGVVTLEVDALTLPAVRAALLRGATAVDGRRGKARYVAESQLTKRRRTHAGAAAYAKWAAWAGALRTPSRPPCTTGCRVLTRPSIISGKPVRSATSLTGRPKPAIAALVPPVETSSTPRPARVRATSSSPALSDNEIRARTGLIASGAGGKSGAAGMGGVR